MKSGDIVKTKSIVIRKSLFNEQIFWELPKGLIGELTHIHKSGDMADVKFMNFTSGSEYDVYEILLEDLELVSK